MQCERPIKEYRTGSEGLLVTLRCGSCKPCRLRAQQSWIARLLAEQYVSTCVSFCTLTMNDTTLEDLNVTTPQKFLKRLRKRTPGKIRYFLCGEYGSKTNRPHYHAIIFSTTEITYPLLQDAWQQGFVQVSPMKSSLSSMRYATKYVWKDDSLKTMSRKPGLGSSVFTKLGEKVAHMGMTNLPQYVQFGSRKYPIHKTCRDYLSVGYQRIAGVPPRIGFNPITSDLTIRAELAYGVPAHSQGRAGHGKICSIHET